MSSTVYYLLCLLCGLLLIAVASAGIAWRERRRAIRQHETMRLQELLARSSEWVAAQRHALCFQAPGQESDPAVHEIATIVRRWYPDVAREAQWLVHVHDRLQNLLLEHHRHRARDPEAAFEAGRDATFLVLSREHTAWAQALEQRLARAAGAGAAPSYVSFPS